jgi:hypothetical protein
MDEEKKAHEWEVNLVRDRFQYLDLSFEQAAQIHAFETESPLFDFEFYFSDWETYDYEWYRMSRILREDQLKIYESHIGEAMVRHDEGLREADARKAKYHVYRQHALAYIHENHFLSLQDELITRNHLMMSVRTKADYLRAEYSRYLRIQRERILTNHFRHYRRTSPNELEIQLLLLDEQHIWPNYFGFKDFADTITMEMLGQLIDRFNRLPVEWVNNIKTKKGIANAHLRMLSEQLSDPTPHAYVFSVKQAEKDMYDSLIFFLIMVDAKQYGRQQRH